MLLAKARHSEVSPECEGDVVILTPDESREKICGEIAKLTRERLTS